ncbi:hypothetical protein CHS0354_005219 [Potamilus streckersoni]|uniref:Uncharacterized protein n=1 Tax=Potamilus streckersoni TaxID=2493646 RepID=A0AAE0VNP8_9BIVA|nr:hypothetical protein CHS0354_005219 [Potamilus streckersoni]
MECSTSSDGVTQAKADGPARTHMENLKFAVGRTIGKVLSSVKYTHIIKGYSSVEKKSPGTLKKIHEDMMNKLNENLKMEIDQMFEEEHIQSYMDGLDKLKSCDRDLEKVAWRPSRNPEEDIMASIDPMKEKQLVEMEKLLHDLESENKLLMGAIKSRQNLLLETKDKVDRHMDKLRRVVDIEKMIPMQEFIDFVNQYTER